MIPLLLATRNAHKTTEFAAILGPDYAVTDLNSGADFAEVEETGRTFEENAMLKAVAASRMVPCLVVADDSGLEVDALGGAPGIYSARYSGAEATDEQNVAKLLAELRATKQSASSTARFRCVIAVAQGGAAIATFSGSVQGSLRDPPIGGNGFGYDPVFVPDGFDQTFAQLDEQTKNRISHRAEAVKQLQRWLILKAHAPTAQE